ncbi:uncharacterized protein LOC115241099 isoform X1 [Formica exsecta]|uniref:uncharacterized protein LOC115241099 isoform X1 n=1 Tax=Formica exsecta TaxID=72781 RepID=UPI001144F5E4|nr:uncharacterized protein LOC115241099 isoform X1 [Formica exsecta]XP_029672517.1 uncharacterized protein LOC115241099 isoform X1 [Formica exsecta]
MKYCKKIHAENIVLNKQILNKVGHKIHDLELKINVLTYKMQYGTWPLPHQIYNLNPKKMRKNKMTLPNPNDRKKHVSQKESNLSKNEDSILQWQNVQFLPLNLSEINRQFSRTLLTQNGKYSTYSMNNTYNLCQKFTDTVHKCKSFLKELEYNNKRLHSLSNSEISSEMSKASSLKIADSAKQIAFVMTEKREASHDAYIIKKEEKINKMKYMKKEKDKMIQNVTELFSQSNVNISTDVAVLTNNDALSKEFVSIFPISQPTHNVQSSREILYEVKKRLRSLHNVLRTYQDISRSSERHKSIDKINEIDAFTSIEKTDENKIDINCNGDSKENLPRIQCSVVSSSEYFEFDCSEESSSSLTEYSSDIPKAYQYSNDVILQNEDITKTTLFNRRKKIPEVVSGKICYISSPESFEDQNIQIQNKVSSIKNFTTKKYRDVFDIEQCQENVITSQKSGRNKISNDSDREERSTTLLLQEALHFKKALLTRVQSKKECPIDSIKENNVKDEFLSELNNNNFPSIVVDIKLEEPITNDSHDKINQCYIYLEMKQRRDLFPEYLQKVNAFTHHESKRNIENQNCIFETPSQYFSITNLTIPNNKVGNNVSLKPPVYEKVISIVIPVRLECQSEIDINEKLIQTKTVLRNIQTRVNPQKNFRKNVDNIDNNVADKHSPTMLKFEDLILEHIKNIRDYIDTFLQSQNRAISKARKVLQYQSKRHILRCLNETSHIVLHNRLIAPSNCNSNDHIVNSLNSSNLLLINAEPNYKQQISIKDNILKCYSDMCLRRNPGMFVPITPIKDKFSNRNTQHLATIELKRKEADLYRPVTLKYYYKNRSKSTDNLDLEKYIMTDIKNGKINKKQNS